MNGGLQSDEATRRVLHFSGSVGLRGSVSANFDKLVNRFYPVSCFVFVYVLVGEFSDGGRSSANQTRKADRD